MPTGLRRRHRTTNAASAFTLIELLVVISIISLLIGILLPSLGTAFRVAQNQVCSSLQRQLMQGMISYSLENDDKIPGINNAGLELAVRECEDALSYASRRITPVQNWDWMTSSVNPDTLPIERSARMWHLFDTYRCPSMKTRVVIYPDGDCGTGDAETYLTSRADGIPTGVSYLMNAYWQLAGGITATAGSVTVYRQDYLFMTPVRMQAGYSARIAVVGTPSDKAAFGDGFRYLDENGVVDFDASIAPRFYGSFTDSSPAFRRSAAYGAASPSGGRQLPLSYRHEMTMNAAFFDGHVANLTVEQARDPVLWFPAGSQVTSLTDLHESIRSKYTLGQILH